MVSKKTFELEMDDECVLRCMYEISDFFIEGKKGLHKASEIIKINPKVEPLIVSCKII